MSNITSAGDPVNPVYLAYNEDGFHLGLFIPALIYSILAIVGIPLNISVCHLTIKYRTLRCNTCILLAMNSFFEILHQFGHFVFLALSISGINFFPLRLALPLQAVSIIGVNTGSKLLALLSIDRLFAVAAPIYYRQINQTKYIFGHIFVISAFNVYYLYFMILGRINYPEWPCTGNVGDFFALPGIVQSIQFTSFGVFSATILAYLLVGILVKFKTETSTERQQKIYRSLLLIVLVSINGYFVSTCLNLLNMFSLLPLTKLQFWFFMQFGATLVNIAAISNAPILYYTSMDYRSAFLKEFGPLIRIICRQNQDDHSQSRIAKVYPLSTQINNRIVSAL